MKYNVGDKVLIKSIDWYNENKDEDGIVELSTHVFIPEMVEHCGTVVTIKDVFEDIDDNVVYYMEDVVWDWTNEMIEGLAEETKPIDFTIKATDTKGKVEVVIPEGYSYVIENDKLYFITEKKEVTYPKTYEECCEILQYNKYLKIYPPFNADIPNYDALQLFDLLEALRKLRICRDAYWKIAGDEMGLDKPWEPDWNDEEQDKYGFHDEVKYTIINSATFVFPTEEMRDAFKENFDSDIEICK